METVAGGTCETDANSGMPADDCIYVVDGPAELKSSVMAIPYFPGLYSISILLSDHLTLPYISKNSISR